MTRDFGILSTEVTQADFEALMGYLTDLAEARGRQELFTKQSAQKLKRRTRLDPDPTRPNA